VIAREKRQNVAAPLPETPWNASARRAWNLRERPESGLTNRRGAVFALHEMANINLESGERESFVI
jgi:hypothetical protein